MNNDDQINNLRHSCAHLLAAAVLDLYPEALPTLGPSIENGFYYDFDNLKISDSDLTAIESKMHELVKNWKGFEKVDVNLAEVEQIFAKNVYKIEMATQYKDAGLTLYKSGDFTDLCRGGHCEHPDQELKYFKLMSTAGAYWRGDEKNKMLTRIYGTAWSTQNELDDYLFQQEEAKKRDHRKLGRELDLFTFSPMIGSGLPLYTPKGAFIRLSLAKFIEDLQAPLGYQQVWTPQIAKAELFKTSGHYDKYKADMFRVISNYSEEEFYLKPMNCPQHTQIYASQARSYRDLPLRYTDFAMLYRDERPGELNGLARVRSFSQDDCHIFCREDQVDFEIDQALQMIKKAMDVFGFKYRYRLSTRDPEHPEKYLGHPETWDRVEKWAVEIMKRNKIDYYDGPGEAAFYAPKMDLMATDALGREWQLSTVQIDYVQPERFGLKYVDTDGKDKTPVMIHRAVVGSPERMLMILLEHYAGAFPVWLAPVQVSVLPISEKHLVYSQTVMESLKLANIRCELDSRSESLGAKIRDAEMQKVPYILVMGDKEAQSESVSVRTRGKKESDVLKIEEFKSLILDAIMNRK